MSLAIVPITVPASGEGPAANIAALVGPKTVTLTGRFSGSYTLLGTHNGANFVPVLVFNAGGVESIKLTLPDAYSSVLVRCNANTTPLGPVTMTVAGVSLPGENLFATLATFLAGVSGTTSPVFDLATLFPPTGLEEGINIICEGGLVGALLVEGSQDGVAFNVVGTFQGGQSPRPLVGLPAPLEFTPLSTGDQVRYLRFGLQGRTTSDVSLTVGGRVPAGSGGVGIPVQAFLSDAGGSNYQVLGAASAPALDILNVVSGYNTVGLCPRATILGNGNTIVAGSTNTNVVGTANYVQGSSCSLIGESLTIPDANNVILVGAGSSVWLLSHDSVVAGFGCTVGAGSQNATVAGSNCVVGDTSTSVVAVGTGLIVGASSPNSTLVGSALTSGGLSSTLLGTTLTNAASNNALLAGAVLVNLGSNNVILAGVGNTIEVGSHTTTVVGFGCVVGERCGSTVVVSSGFVVPDGCNNTTAVGSAGSLGVGSPYCVLLGTAPIGATSPVSVCINGGIGDNADHSCAILGSIGAAAGISAKENFCFGNTAAILDGSIQCVLIGGGNGISSVIETACSGSILLGAGCAIRSSSDGSFLAGLLSTIINSPSSVCVGRSNILDATGTLSSFVTIVGGENNLHADLHASSRMAIFGHANNTTGLLNTVIVGNGNVLADGTGSLVVGLSNAVTAGAAPSEVVLVGKDNTVSAALTSTVGIGCTGAGARSVVIGYQSLTTSPGTNCVVIGSSSEARGANDIAIGNTAVVDAGCQGSAAYGAGAHATTAFEVIFDGNSVGSDPGILLFHVAGRLSTPPSVTPPDLVRFEGAAAVNPLDSGMFLFYINTAGTRVSQQVKVQAVTGLLYVPV